MLTKFYPSEHRRSIFDVDLDHLQKEGIEGLIVDLDNTIVARGSHTAPDELKVWFTNAKERGFRICILSNNWMTRVSNVAAQLDLPLVARAAKPRKKAFTQAMNEIGTTVSTTAVIGDQIFTDVFGGNLAGVYTILVAPISDREAPHTRVLRRIERVVMKSYYKKSRVKKNGNHR